MCTTGAMWVVGDVGGGVVGIHVHDLTCMMYMCILHISAEFGIHVFCMSTIQGSTTLATA